MATQTFTYTSQNELACAGCNPADVIICLNNPDLIAQQECPITLDGTVFSYNHILGQLVQTKKFQNCGKWYFEYTIAYDDADLVPPNLIICTDVSGIVCEGCLTTFVRDTAGQEVYIEDGPGGQELVTQHGCRYPITSSGYQFTFSGDSGPVQTVDNADNVEYIGGASIATTAGAGEQLTIDLELSTDAPNIAVFGGDGNLFVEGPAFAVPTPYFIGT